MKAILIGLFAALLQSLSYLVSASFVRTYADRRSASTALTARSYLVMGLLSALALPAMFLRHGAQIPSLSLWWYHAAGGVLAGMVAQVAMFFTLKAADASRISPLTGIKILFVALLCIIFRGDTYAPLQWAGIALAIVAAYLLSRNGGRLSPAGLAGLLVTCVAFAASDFSIRLQQEVFHAHAASLPAQGLAPLSSTLSNFVIVWVDYAIGGVISLLVLPATGRYTARAWRTHVVPYAFIWLGAMCVLFVSFELLGVVQGTIVQSTRGLISILLGYLIARFGLSTLERRLPPAVQIARVLAGLLMFLAILLFALGG